ncbi:MAG: sigma 54-interacting transcriptional regulator [Planctomycetaceae bacterium]|nr:sigma 54-interacting transcriptional regulator [Planctomycetaceae bacterium]
MSTVNSSVRELELDALNRIAAVAAETTDFNDAVPRVLQILGDTLGMRYATLALVNSETGVVSIDFGHGLSDEQVRRGHYTMGEGVVGRVAATGTAAIIPSIAAEPAFLNKTGIRSGDASFICVPVILGREILGTLSVDGECRPAEALEEDARFLGVVAAMLAQASKTRLLMKDKEEKLQSENERLRIELRSHRGPRNLIGKSREMQIVFDQIAQVADSSSTVLIHGETGTGKELVAQALHYNGSRADGPFVRVNCAALPETLIESELFGHEKGAFTGAVAARKGRFEQADGGTIFLDEIGDISPLMQVKLLRVLQEREFERVGGSKTLQVDVRVVAATHRDLYAMVRQGTFRGDLYYRINVFPITLLPLRQRPGDLPLLADHFLKKYAESAGKDIHSFSPEVLDMLLKHAWPGNVRELENCVEHAVILAPGPVIMPEHLPAALRYGGAAAETAAPIDLDYKTMVEEFERGVLTQALRETNGNLTRAAALLRTTPRVVSYRVRQLNIDVTHFGGL